MFLITSFARFCRVKNSLIWPEYFTHLSDLLLRYPCGYLGFSHVIETNSFSLSRKLRPLGALSFYCIMLNNTCSLFFIISAFVFKKLMAVCLCIYWHICLSHPLTRLNSRDPWGMFVLILKCLAYSCTSKSFTASHNFIQTKYFLHTWTSVMFRNQLNDNN